MRVSHSLMVNLRNILLVSLVSAALLAPFVPNLGVTISGKEIQWARQWHDSRLKDYHLTSGSLVSRLWQFLRFSKDTTGRYFLAVAAVGCLVLGLRNIKLWLECLIFAALVSLLVLNAYVWILPWSYVLYPDRVALLLIIPCAVFAAAALDFAQHLPAKALGTRHANSPRRGAVLGNLCLAGVMVLAAPSFTQKYTQKYLRKALERTPITKNDLAAFEWIKQNTRPSDIFQNNYGDAGLWIPAMAFRMIMIPPCPPMYFDEMEEGFLGVTPHYVYIGEKTVYYDPTDEAQYEADPVTYKKVFEQGGTKIYKILAARPETGLVGNLQVEGK